VTAINLKILSVKFFIEMDDDDFSEGILHMDFGYDNRTTGEIFREAKKIFNDRINELIREEEETEHAANEQSESLPESTPQRD